jgi:hypothetical protein
MQIIFLRGPLFTLISSWDLFPIFLLKIGFANSWTSLSQLKFGTTIGSGFFKWEERSEKEEENSSSFSYHSQQFARLARGMETGLRCLKLQSKGEWGLGGKLMLGISARAAVSGLLSRHKLHGIWYLETKSRSSFKNSLSLQYRRDGGGMVG